MKVKLFQILLTGSILTASLHAQSGDVIRIEKGTRIPLTVSDFSGTGGAQSRSILINDLNLTSAFEMVAPGGGGYVITATVGADSLQGSLNSPSGQSLLNQSFTGDLRTITHQFADAIFEKLTGQKGIATSQVAFISGNSGHKEVYLMDLDGHNLVQVTRDNSIALSPHFSPDNRKIAFASYKSGYADVWVIDLNQKKKTRIAYFPGVNSSPSFSPDGQSLALVLSRSGNPELHTMPSAGGDPVRLTRTRGTESSPTWSPDGREIIFVSDDRGSPQLYRISTSGGDPQRLKTFSTYTTEPDWSPDGKKLAYSIMESGQGQIWVMDLSSGERTNLTTGGVCESPVWTRNSRHLIYAQGGALYLLDSVTRNSVKLKIGISGCTQPTCTR